MEKQGVPNQNNSQVQPPPIGFQPGHSAPYPMAPPSYAEVLSSTTTTTTVHQDAYPQLQKQYPQLANQDPQTTTQIITIVTQNAFGPHPTVITCPSCHQQVQTKIDYVASSRTHLWAFILCLLCWPLMCVPYCTDSCNNANHHCPNCGCYLGTYASD